MSSPDTCTCQEQCPKDDFCACMLVYTSDAGDDGDCRCDCGIVIHPSHLLPASARVAISTDGIDLARLAAFLDRQCDVDVFVPEGRKHEKVSLYMRDSTVADVIEAAGLRIRDSSF
jgi:hypothetical protein